MLSQPQSQTPSTRRHMVDGSALAFLALLLISFYWRFLIGSRYIWDDTLVLLYPGVNYFARSIYAGRFPLWFPGVRDGLPFYSDMPLGVFYPLQWFLPLFVKEGRLPFLAYQWYIVFHYFLGGTFLYAFLRQLKLSPVGALGGAIVFCFSGFASLTIVSFVRFQVCVWLPLQLLCVHRFTETGTRKAWWGLVGALLMSLLAGYPQTTVYCWYLVIAYWLYRGYWNRCEDDRTWGTALRQLVMAELPRQLATFALVFGLAAVMVLPSAQNWLHTSRPRQAFQEQADPSLPYHGLLTLFVPNFYGISSARDPACPFWGYDPTSPSVIATPPAHGVRGFWQYWEFGIYASQLFLLALLLIPMNWRRVTDKPTAGFFLAVWFVAMWFMLGRYGGLFNVLYHVLPGVSLFRGPAKMSCLATFAAAVLTGCFTDQVRKEDCKLRLWPVSLLIAAYLAILTLLTLGGGNLSDELRNPRNLGWSRQETLWALSLMVLYGSGILCATRCTARWTRSIGLFTLLAVSGADFHHAYANFHCGLTNPDDQFPKDNWLLRQVKQVREQAGPFRLGQIRNGKLGESLVTDRNLAYFHDFLEVPEGYTSFSLDSIARFRATTNLIANLAIQNVKIVAWEDQASEDQHQIRWRMFNNPLPRAKFFTAVRRYDSRDALLTALERNELDWSRETAVWGPATDAIEQLIRQPSSMGTNDEVRFVSRTPEMYSIIYNVSQPGVIFVAESFYPGWVADGGRFRMIEVFGAFHGIVIPGPGHGEITVRFSPPVLKAGLFVSLLSSLIAVLVASRLRSRRFTPS